MFTNKSDFNLYLEQLKKEHSFETYLETVMYFIEYESDQEPEQVAKQLNKKIVEEIAIEANENGLIKFQDFASSLFESNEVV